MAFPRKSFVAAPSAEGEPGKQPTPSSSSIEQKSSSMLVRTNLRAPIRKARVASASFFATYILTVLLVLLPQPASTFSLQLQTASSPPPLSSSSPPSPKKQNPPPSSSTYLSSLEPDPPSYSDQIAVVLNVNARSVTQSSVAAAESIVGASNVFVTTTEEESDEAARIIVRRGYGTVVPAGGDGTLCSVINSIVDARRRQRRRASLDGVVNGGGEAAAGRRKLPLPRFAFLPLGTGNGMGMLVGPRGRRRKEKKVVNMLTTLKEMVELASADRDIDDGVPPVPVPTLKCPMIEILTEDDLLYPEKRKGGGSSSVNVTNGATRAKGTEIGLGGGGVHGELCFFAGAGFDSLMLSDFNKVKRWSSTKPGPIRRVLGSVAGYTVALLVRTLPQCLVWGRHKLKVRVTVPRPSGAKTHGERATTYWMDPRRGDTAMEVTPPLPSQLPKPGESVFPTKIEDDRQLLFEGETGIVAAGTTPYYGGGLKLFPFSRVQPHGMHLRLGRINPFLGFVNIPWIFRGTYRHYNMGCLDFVGPDFDVEVSEPYPFQHSGEAAEENIARFRLRVADEEVEFVDFLRPRLVVGY